MNRGGLTRRWSIWVPLLAVALALGLCGLLFLSVYLFQPQQTGSPPTAVFTVIAAPTSTPAPPPEQVASPTPTLNSLVVDGIGVGMYVQITGTDGDGLRLRSGPGTDQAPRFLGRDSEVFEVKDGPREASGYTWWYLVTPYDESRSGWAAANFLAVVAKPTP
ncbi:MAG TPA: hypothetical protein VHO48_08010 [Anaerolineaceae bacterium]|nr:hypothetical protein [Anaerolineaceae bacterium]